MSSFISALSTPYLKCFLFNKNSDKMLALIIFFQCSLQVIIIFLVNNSLPWTLFFNKLKKKKKSVIIFFVLYLRQPNAPDLDFYTKTVFEMWTIPSGGLSYQSCFPITCLYLPKPSTTGKNVTQGRFLSGVKLVWIQSFLSLRLVAFQSQKKPVCLTIHS